MSTGGSGILDQTFYPRATVLSVGDFFIDISPSFDCVVSQRAVNTHDVWAPTIFLIM